MTKRFRIFFRLGLLVDFAALVSLVGLSVTSSTHAVLRNSEERMMGAAHQCMNFVPMVLFHFNHYGLTKQESKGRNKVVHFLSLEGSHRGFT